MLKNVRLVLLAILIISVSNLVTSCGGEEIQSKIYEKSKEYANIKDSALSIKMKEKLDQIIANMPLPITIVTTLASSGAQYNPKSFDTILNPDAFSSTARKAVTLGILGTDLAYYIGYGKNQESLQCLKSCRKLTDDLGVPLAFDNDIIKDFESKMNDKNAVQKILTDGFDRLKESLKQNEQFDVATLVVIGSWIEGMYLSAINYPSNGGEVKKKLFEQRDQLSTVLQFLADFEDEQFVSDKMLGRYLELNELKKIDNFFFNLKDKNNIDKTEVEKLAEIMKDIRKKLI